MSGPTSSPLRSSSKKVKSDHHTPPVSDQAELQKRLSKELHHHAWQFDAERVAEMLSANGKGPTEAVVKLAHKALCDVLKEQAPGWPAGEPERVWYSPLATYLNNCADACRSVLRDSKSPAADSRPLFYDLLKFIVYDKTTRDGVEGASPVKPDLVGGLDLVHDDRVAWSPQEPHIKHVLLPVEVKADWAPMILQAATYARCLFSASPSRQFAVVLGFRHSKAELRFLVFHRGGLTGSKPFSVNDEQGQQDILRVLLSILNWRSTEDAGFPGFHNDFEMSLFRHKNDGVGVVASVTEVLHDGLCVLGRASRVLLMSYPTGEGKKPESCIPALGPTTRTRKRRGAEAQTRQGDEETQSHVTPVCRFSRAPVRCPSSSELVWSSALETDASNRDHAHVVVKYSWCEGGRQKVEADLLTKCKDAFGTPDHHYSFCPTDTRGAPMSTARFLPTDDERLEDSHWAITPGSQVPSRPQRRYLWIHVSKLVGRSLIHAKTPWELYIATGHAMLGWLEMLRRGFLHRDVSIGNTLMLDPSVTMKPFEVRTIEQLMTQLSLEQGGGLNKYVEQLEGAIKKVGHSGECHGFIIDGDMAARLEGYFTSRDMGEASGTYEFMSDALRRSLWTTRSYLHSPVDDLISFCFTAQWAAAFNDGAGGGRYNGIEIQEFREMITGDRRADAVSLARDILRHPSMRTEYGPFFARSLDILNPWWIRLTALVGDWSFELGQTGALEGKDKEERLRLNFLIFGYRGVGEYFELVHEHRASLQTAV